jgi:hypothetical protein
MGGEWKRQSALICPGKLSAELGMRPVPSCLRYRDARFQIWSELSRSGSASEPWVFQECPFLVLGREFQKLKSALFGDGMIRGCSPKPFGLANAL